VQQIFLPISCETASCFLYRVILHILFSLKHFEAIINFSIIE